jgi:hypothetical protein
MSTGTKDAASTSSKGSSNVVQITDFVVAKLGGKFLRFQTVEEVPADAEAAITLASASAMTKEQLGEIYSFVAGVSPKNFKSAKIALDSLTYQVGKMPIFDPSAPKAEPVVAGKGEAKASKGTGEKFARKSDEMFELLSPPETAKVLQGLAPQARELVLIMTELAAEKKDTKFSGADLNAKLKIPEVSARLRTKQDPLRILQYYKGRLIGAGLIKTS